MVLGDVVAGIQLVKQSVAFIKDNINTCKDISEIAGSIDELVEGKKQVDKRRNKKDGGSLADQFGKRLASQEAQTEARIQSAMERELLKQRGK